MMFFFCLFSIVCGTFELFEAPSEKWQKGGEVVSQFRPNFTMSAKFHNFSQISQFRQNFTILTRFHNFDQISQLRQNFTISANQEYLAFLKYLEYLEYIRVRAVSQFLRCFLQRWLPFIWIVVGILIGHIASGESPRRRWMSSVQQQVHVPVAYWAVVFLTTAPDEKQTIWRSGEPGARAHLRLA